MLIYYYTLCKNMHISDSFQGTVHLISEFLYKIVKMFYIFSADYYLIIYISIMYLSTEKKRVFTHKSSDHEIIHPFCDDQQYYYRRSRCSKHNAFEEKQYLFCHLRDISDSNTGNKE